MSEVTFGLVKPADLPEVWPMVAEYLAAALVYSEQREWSCGELFRKIQAADFVLAVAMRNGCVIGGLVLDHGTDPRGNRYVAVVCCGGHDMQAWLSGIVSLTKKLGELASADRVVICGRRGWERVLRPYGLRQRAAILSAGIDELQTPVDFDVIGGWGNG